MNVTVELSDELTELIIARRDATGTAVGLIMHTAISEYLLPRKIVLNDWLTDLSYMQQSVLLAMVRNADGIGKHHPQKELIKWFRRCILKSAFDGKHLEFPTMPGGGSFTGPVDDIERALDSFIWARDEMTLHYFAHAMHAFEILGYKYPHPGYREFWHRAYLRCVDTMHMLPETEEMMDRRLCDNPETWMEREDKCGGCTRTDPIEPSDGAIYAEVSRKRADEHALQDAEDTLRAIARSHEPEPEPDRAPIPTWASVRADDNRFVNNSSGLDLGNEFEIRWGHRKNEFPAYVEPRDKTRPFYDDPTDKSIDAFKGIV